MYVAGYFSYECGHSFENNSCISSSLPHLPLVWLGVYAGPRIFDHAHDERVEEDSVSSPATNLPNLIPVDFSNPICLKISQADYCAKIEKIQTYLAAGDAYQVNFTDKVLFSTSTTAAEIFRTLIVQQPVAFSAWLHMEDQHILSFSPEMFFKIANGKIQTRPMKGTLPRGMDAEEDVQCAIRLQRDEKNRSEHVMIVDLLRNDLGRICNLGSIQVEDIFSIEKYATLLQMTSTISGILRPNITYHEIFCSMFPSGSVTGAPKLRAKQIIQELEQGPRGVYTGAIGYFSPNGSSTFNVAIRTLMLHNGSAEMGVGGGHRCGFASAGRISGVLA